LDCYFFTLIILELCFRKQLKETSAKVEPRLSEEFGSGSDRSMSDNDINRAEDNVMRATNAFYSHFGI
jgi:hypothetical protein